MLHNHFERVVVINLDRRPDRWAGITERLNIIGTKATRFSAIDYREISIPSHWRYPHGAYASLLSYIEVIGKALYDGVDSLLLIEDDTCFLDPAGLVPFVKKIPSDWDAIYFGGCHYSSPEPVTLGVSRLVHTRGVEMHALRLSFVKGFLHLISRKTHWYDVMLAGFQPFYNFYGAVPGLTGQDGGPSDNERNK